MKILAYLSLSIMINLFAYLIKSDFIHSFPGADFLTMLVMIMTINTATSSYIISKLEELANAIPGKTFTFVKTYKHIRLALYEQVVLVVISFLVLIIRSSDYLNDKSVNQVNYCEYYKTAIDIFLTLIFIMIIGILWDTGKSIFAITIKPNDQEK